MWAAPVDGSAAPHRMTPELQIGEVLHGRSLISPDGRGMIYGITGQQRRDSIPGRPSCRRRYDTDPAAEALAAGESFTNDLANDALTRIVYVVQTEPTPGTFALALHAADVATAQSGVHVADLPTIGAPPIVSRIHPSCSTVHVR